MVLFSGGRIWGGGESKEMEINYTKIFVKSFTLQEEINAQAFARLQST